MSSTLIQLVRVLIAVAPSVADAVQRGDGDKAKRRLRERFDLEIDKMIAKRLPRERSK